MLKVFKRIMAYFGILNKFRKSNLYKDLAEYFNADLRKLILLEKEFYSQFIHAGNLCFDIGANIGGKTNIFSKLKARIVAVEPDPGAFSVLQKRFGSNRNIRILNVALDREKSISLLNKGSLSTLSTLSETDMNTILTDSRFQNMQYTEKVPVEVLKLDELISEYGLPDFCKISVVGYELNVLKGLSTGIPCLSFGCNRPAQVPMAISCVDLLAGLGSYHFNLIKGSFMNGWQSKEWFNQKDIIEELKRAESEDGYKYIEIYARLNA